MIILRKRYIPYSGLYELTLRCNMRCIHCGSSAGIKRETELTTKQWNTCTTELSELGCKLITLLGGEPFLRNDWWDIAKNIRDFRMRLVIISNGLRIKEKTIEQLRKLEPYAVAISIDGGSAKTHDYIRQRKGSFESCLKALSKLCEAGISTTVITTVNKINFKELPKLRSILMNKGIAWQLQIAAPLGRFPKKLMLSKREFYAVGLFIAASRSEYRVKELPIVGAHSIGYYSNVLPNININPRWNGCQAGISAIGIQSDGGVKGCLSLPDEFIEGNIRRNTISEIWNDARFCSYNRRFSIDNLEEGCRGCRNGSKCRGGCLAVSMGVLGKRYADPYCFNRLEQTLS